MRARDVAGLDEPGRIYEAILEAAGGFGFYQAFSMFYYLISTFTIAANTAFMVYGSIKPPGYSQLGGNTTLLNSTTENLNITHLSVGNISETASNAMPFWSVAAEWDLFGDNAHILSNIISVQMAGNFIGPILAGLMSDRYGRKWTYFGSLFGLIIFGLASAFVQSWAVFTGIRFFIGLFLGATYSTLLVFTMETLQQRHRYAIQFGGWPAGYIFSALMAKATSDWRSMTLVIQIPGVIALAATMLIVRSPKWLLDQGMVGPARFSVNRILQWNTYLAKPKVKLAAEADVALQLDNLVSLMSGGEGHQIVPGSANSVQQKSNNDEKFTKSRKPAAKRLSYKDLFYNKSAAYTTIFSWFSWFCASAIHWGLLFNVGNLAGDAAINTIIIMVSRAVAQILFYVVEIRCERLGRRVALLAAECGLGATVAFLASAQITSLGSTNPVSLTVASIIGLTVQGIVWAVLETFTIEIFPTQLRNTGTSSCVFACYCGGMVAPQIFLTQVSWPPAPYIILAGILAVWVLYTGCVMPETKGKPLPALPLDLRSSNRNATLSQNEPNVV